MSDGGLVNLIGKGLSAAGSFRTLAVPVAIAISLGLAAFTEGPAVWRWISHRGAAAQAKTDAKVVTAATAIGTDSAQQLAAHAHAIDRITATTEAASHEILVSPGAATSAPAGVAGAMHDALCLSEAYAAAPDCVAVRADHPGIGAAGADPGSNPPR